MTCGHPPSDCFTVSYLKHKGASPRSEADKRRPASSYELESFEHAGQRLGCLVGDVKRLGERVQKTRRHLGGPHQTVYRQNEKTRVVRRRESHQDKILRLLPCPGRGGQPAFV